MKNRKEDSEIASKMDIKKSIVIIKANARSGTSAEQFLRNRGWVLFSTNVIIDGLAYIVKNRPSFVILALDHPNKKIRTIAPALTQSFGCCVIVYTESSTSNTYRLLLEAGVPYKINPPLTGPAIERTVFKYLRDREGKPVVPEASLTKKRDPLNFGKIKKIDKKERALGNVTKDKDTMIPLGPQDVPDQIPEILSSTPPDGAPVVIPGEGDEFTEFLRNQAATQVPEGDAANAPTLTLKEAMNTVVPEDEESVEEKKPVTPVYDEGDYAEKKVKARPEEELHIPKEKKGVEYGAHVTTEEAHESFNQEVHRVVGENHKGFEKKTRDALVGALSQSTQRAIDETVKDPTAEAKNRVGQVSNAACIVVESEKFSGYLVAASAQDKPLDVSFVKTIKTKLFKFLRDQGQTVSDEQNYQLKLKQVDFQGWALECAEFLRKTVHGTNEVAIGFFPHTPAKVHFEKSPTDDMGAVKLNEIKGDTIVDFNLYYYMPANNKYVLYTPKGSKFYERQKTRLEEMGVTHLHIKKTESAELTKYRAQHHLNSSIEEYEKLKKIRKSA